MISTFVCIAATGLFALSLLVPQTSPAAVMTGTITGRVIDASTLQPLQDVNIYLGIPGAFVWAHSAADGSFTIDLTPIQYNPTTPWQVYFVKAGYVTTPTNKFTMTTSGYVFGSEPAIVPASFPLPREPAPPGP